MFSNVFNEIKDEPSSISGSIPFQLKELAKYIQTPQNIKTLSSNQKQIDFSNFYLKYFCITDSEYFNLLNSVLHNFQLDLRKLQAIDIKLILSISFGFISLALVPVSMGLTSILAAAAFTYVGHLIKSREIAYEEYSVTLQHMTNVYIWAMNNENSVITNDSQLIAKQFKISNENLHVKIKLMLELVNPLLSDHNIQNYTQKVINDTLNVELSLTDETTIANKNDLSSSYLLYGQHQGNKLQLSHGFFEIARRSTVNGIYRAANILNFSKNDTITNETDIEECTAALK